MGHTPEALGGQKKRGMGSLLAIDNPPRERSLSLGGWGGLYLVAQPSSVQVAPGLAALLTVTL